MEGEKSLSNELTKTAYNQSIKAHSHHHSYLTRKRDDANPSIIAVKGSMDVQELYCDDHFGETNVDGALFPSLRRIGEDVPAKVNASVLEQFKDLLISPGFKTEVERILKEEKRIILTGHSGGGAIASLVTLWVLDEYKRRQKLEFQIDCVTFGSPLVGDGTVTHAVRREKWAGHFTNFVMEHDIVPRMMLAPKTSVQKHLPNIREFFNQKVNATTTQKSNRFTIHFTKKTTKGTTDHDDQVVDGKQAENFFENVLINASTVASHDAYDLMEPTNSIKEKLSADFVKVSPYRPFGVYVFCTQGEESKPRQQLVVENPNAVLQLLFYFLQLPSEDQDIAEFALDSLNEHFSYGEELSNERAYLKELNKDLLTSKGTTGEAVRTSNKVLFELTASAKWCLLAGEEAENRKKENADKIKEYMKKDDKSNKPKKIIEDMMKEIITYKEKVQDKTADYYAAFMLNDTENDFKANMNRLEQAKIWDEVVEMVKRKDLPDDFEVWDEFLELATRFRRLYEPLDIANYYRHAKGVGYNVGPDMGNRPKRYKFPQRWYQHANVMTFEKITESNFVAEVEQLIEEVKKPKNMTLEMVKKEFESIKDKVKKWQSDDKIGKPDVYWGESVMSKLEGMLASP